MMRAILFDCDGVIADSEPSWNEIDREHLQFFGVPDYRGEYKAEVLGKSLWLSDELYREKFGLAHVSVEEMVAKRVEVAQRFYATTIPLFEGVAPVLREIKARNLKTALATSSVSSFIVPFLARHEIGQFFDAVVTGEMVKNGKPNPDIYLLAAQKVGVSPENCLVVEDAISGLQAGRSAGCATVAIPDPRWLDPQVFEGKSDHTIAKISELPALVAQLCGEKK